MWSVACRLPPSPVRSQHRQQIDNGPYVRSIGLRCGLCEHRVEDFVSSRAGECSLSSRQHGDAHPLCGFGEAQQVHGAAEKKQWAAGMCWLWLERRRSSSRLRQNRAADRWHLGPRMGGQRPLKPQWSCSSSLFFVKRHGESILRRSRCGRAVPDGDAALITSEAGWLTRVAALPRAQVAVVVAPGWPRRRWVTVAADHVAVYVRAAAIPLRP